MILATETVDDLRARFGPSYVPLVAVSGMIASFTMVLTGTMVNVAIPNVMGAFGVGQDQAQLMTTAFVVAMTTSQLLNVFVVAVIGQRARFSGRVPCFGDKLPVRDDRLGNDRLGRLPRHANPFP